MPYYRLYHLNRSSGHIDRAEEFDAADDVKAVAIVRERERDTPVELWQEGRKILQLDGPSDMSAPTEPEEFRSAAAG
ncbi:MAG TPA: hypothetical protein VEX35_08250 [Allosphingosinicella sp.]|nr:hypothetical protein [Allosphingosinicella sp.]